MHKSSRAHLSERNQSRNKRNSISLMINTRTSSSDFSFPHFVVGTEVEKAKRRRVAANEDRTHDLLFTRQTL